VVYEGKTYKTVVIGNQTWMASNLNYDAEGSVCYENCVKYGRLYNWATAMQLPSSCNSTSCSDQVNAKHKGICPTDWHIPNNDDWETLVDFVGDSFTAGTKLKAKSGWNENGNGEDTYGFAALPGGMAQPDGGFEAVGNSGVWRSASEDDAVIAFIWVLDYDDETEYGSTYQTLSSKRRLFSVRCVKD
jgi:uncharacterized protein (TIGR02145 family)